MSDELLDIFNENDVSLGVQKMKSEAHNDGSWHRVAHNWIYNSQNEVLLQLRASQKLLYPNRWDISAAGHVSANEEVETSAQREIEEEIGIKVRKSDLQFFRKVNYHIDFNGMNINEITYVYLYKYDHGIADLSLQKEEVAQIKFVHVDEVKKELDLCPENFTPGKEDWFSILDKIKELNSRK